MWSGKLIHLVSGWKRCFEFSETVWPLRNINIFTFSLRCSCPDSGSVKKHTFPGGKINLKEKNTKNGNRLWPGNVNMLLRGRFHCQGSWEHLKSPVCYEHFLCKGFSKHSQQLKIQSWAFHHYVRFIKCVLWHIHTAEIYCKILYGSLQRYSENF